MTRHNKPRPSETSRSNDGRDRTRAEVIDNYDPKPHPDVGDVGLVLEGICGCSGT